MGFGTVGIRNNVLRFQIERLNDHRHVHNTMVVVYMYLIFVMTGQNISNEGDKGVQFCISATFIEPRVFIREYKFGMYQC